jgi:sugar/nucleoside kinase (ribokinase family)
MQNTASIVALGHAIVDVLARADDAQVAALGLEKGTMALVDGERARGLYAAITPEAHASGGSAANTAACIASLGGRVRFVGKVADDELGRVFTNDIRSAGVEYDTPPGPVTGPHTGRCLVLVSPDAEKTMCTDLGAGATIEPADLHLEAIRAARVLYMEGYLCGPPDTTKTVHEAIAAARQAGTLVAFSASDPGWVAIQRDALLEVLDSVDVLFANQPEALGLSGRGDLDGAVDALLESCPILAVTLGAAGCLVATRDGERARVPAVAVDKVVDSTGAGDSFAAGFLFGLVHGLDHTASARIGAIAAGEIVSHMGARPLTRLADLAGPAGLDPTGR